MASSTSDQTTAAQPTAPHTFFFYGTLMAPSVLARVTSHDTLHPTAPLSRPLPALLHHHRRHRVHRADYPAVVPSKDKGACVRGTVVSGFQDSDVWRLDTFEGPEYERRKITVEVLPVKGATAPETGREIEAYTYIWCAPRRALEDAEWDFDEFVREKMWRWAQGHAETDSGFEDIAKALENKQGEEGGLGGLEREDETDEGSGEKGGADPTGGRRVNGAFEQAVRNVGADEEVMKSAV